MTATTLHQLKFLQDIQPAQDIPDYRKRIVYETVDFRSAKSLIMAAATLGMSYDDMMSIEDGAIYLTTICFVVKTLKTCTTINDNMLSATISVNGNGVYVSVTHKGRRVIDDSIIIHMSNETIKL